MGYDEKEMLRQLADPKTQRKAFEKVVSQSGQTLYWKIRRIVLTLGFPTTVQTLDVALPHRRQRIARFPQKEEKRAGLQHG